jgi:cytoskeletal protein CcmA (bactofilin family)
LVLSLQKGEFHMFFKSAKKPVQQNQSSQEPSYVARDTSFEGNIICDGELHVDGAVRGSIRAHTCLVDAHGEVHGEITAQYVFVRGRVMGPVTGTHVTIQSGAHVEGNITHETISIENGAYVYGSMRQGGITPNQMQSQIGPVPAHSQFFELGDMTEDVPQDKVRQIKAVKS